MSGRNARAPGAALGCALIIPSGNSAFDTPEQRAHDDGVNPEIIIEVTEAEEGGCYASALGYGIYTQVEMLEELRAMAREAVAPFFDDPELAPEIIQLQLMRTGLAA